ncbi:MAG TPA: ATP-binding protein [Azospirillum sp.]|nr:ATP-binding protein [Azospirillum sp.]
MTHVPNSRAAPGRLAQRFAMAAAALSVGLSLLVGGGLYAVSSHGLLEQRRDNIRASAALVARQTEGLLATVTGTLHKLADNSVLATGLVDSAGRETYINPFLQSFQRVAGLPIALVFTDFEGVPIADNGHASMTGADMAWLVQAMAAGERRATIIDEQGRPHLLVAEMLIYSRTASPEGALLYKTPLDAFVLDPQARLLHAGSAAPPTAEGFAVDLPVRVPEILAPLRLSLRLEAPQAPTLSPLSWVLPGYALVGLLALVGIVLGSRAVGTYLTRPLLELEQLAGVIVREGFTGQRARVRGNDEVSGLARAFNAMLDHIAAIQAERERRAAEEITIQRTLAERADRARAEAEAATREAERAREEAVAALLAAEGANETKTRSLAAASHDLRQPVQSLVLMSAALAARLKEHPAATLVGSLQASVDALCRLLEALLDISRLDAGTIAVQVRPVRVSDVFDALETEYRLRASEKGLDLRTVRSSLTLRTDPALLERILRNLLENALRYTGHGRILLGCRRRGGRALIQVHDTGVGIPPEHLKRIFQEFYQVGNAARDRSQGLGLGLAIVERLSRLLRHRVEVRSRPGNGSCFVVEVELAPQGAAAPVPAEAAAARPAAGSAGLALVIDDDQLVRESLRVLIEQAGWRTLSADGAPSALRQLDACAERPALVIADYRLEGGATGVDALRAIEARLARDTLCVVLTGDTAPERIAEARASGYRILHKPLSAPDLLSLLAEAAGVSRPEPAPPPLNTTLSALRR